MTEQPRRAENTVDSTGVQRRVPRTNPKLHAYRTGFRRGMVSTRIMLASTSEILGTLIPIAILIVVLILMQRGTFGDAPIGMGAMNLPSIIAMSVLFSTVMGITSLLAMDRTNGTLLRSKSVPGGTTGYLVGEIIANAVLSIIGAALILVTGLVVFSELEFGTVGRWLQFTLVLLLGLIALLAIGAALGSLISSPKYMGLVFMPMMILIGISGIFYPLVALPLWVQWVAQAFPLYWFGLGMRSSLLPESMAAVEVAGSWRLEWTFLVLIAWAVLALVLAPKLLARMARRESGSAMAARRRDVQREWGV
ncbi:MAG: ABC transporter permease [Leucobacter sp.]